MAANPMTAAVMANTRRGPRGEPGSKVLRGSFNPAQKIMAQMNTIGKPRVTREIVDEGTEDLDMMSLLMVLGMMAGGGLFGKKDGAAGGGGGADWLKSGAYDIGGAAGGGGGTDLSKNFSFSMPGANSSSLSIPSSPAPEGAVQTSVGPANWFEPKGISTLPPMSNLGGGVRGATLGEAKPSIDQTVFMKWLMENLMPLFSKKPLVR